jgi:DNA-binding CsgD family transcriptional regulator
LKATGETPSSNSTDKLRSLTPQELQVALIVAQGITTREAAAALFLSPKTVEFYLSNTHRKLGVRSRAELVQPVNIAPGMTSYLTLTINGAYAAQRDGTATLAYIPTPRLAKSRSGPQSAVPPSHLTLRRAACVTDC